MEALVVGGGAGGGLINQGTTLVNRPGLVKAMRRHNHNGPRTKMQVPCRTWSSIDNLDGFSLTDVSARLPRILPDSPHLARQPSNGNSEPPPSLRPTPNQTSAPLQPRSNAGAIYSME